MAKRARVLVVDDDPRYVQLVRVNMEASGYLVLTAGDGASALRLAETETPDLVILDVMLPEMDGSEVCRRIREFSQVPIIMLTARGEQSQKVEGLRAGADDYVTKPFGVEELLARVEAVLRRTGSELAERSTKVFTLRGLTVDLARHRVTLNGQVVELTGTEYRLLRELVTNAGFILSQSTLLAKIWGNEYREDRDILKVCINRLRNKIESDPHNPQFIQTKRGIGYYFSGEK